MVPVLVVVLLLGSACVVEPSPAAARWMKVRLLRHVALDPAASVGRVQSIYLLRQMGVDGTLLAYALVLIRDQDLGVVVFPDHRLRPRCSPTPTSRTPPLRRRRLPALPDLPPDHAAAAAAQVLLVGAVMLVITVWWNRLLLRLFLIQGEDSVTLHAGALPGSPRAAVDTLRCGPLRSRAATTSLPLGIRGLPVRPARRVISGLTEEGAMKRMTSGSPSFEPRP